LDLVHADHLDVARDVVLAAEIQHLLRLGQAANERAGERTPGAMISGKADTGSGFSGAADKREVAVAFQQVK